jgi:sugar transferase (PEP-CTERM/EpsH1 system associated)
MRILFLTPRFPYPPLKGDSLRAYHQLRTLSSDHKITLLSLAEAPVSAEDYRQVADLCERVIVVPLPRWRAMLNMGLGLLSRQPLQVRYYQSAAFRRLLKTTLATEQFDVVHATLIRMLPYVWDLQGPPVVVDLIDSLSLNLSARYKEARSLKRLAYGLEYRRVRAYERAVVRHFPGLAVSSPADRRVLSYAGSNPVEVIPNGVDVDRFPFHGQEDREPETLVFTGNMGYPPNEDAVLWFADEVWPLLRAERPGVRLWVVGTNPGERVRALERTNPGIEVLGQVPDVTTYLHRATLAVCPMTTGSGIQNKVLEAMSAGAPVVSTSLANRGVRGVPGRDLVVAHDAQEFATAVSNLLDDPARRVYLAQHGRAFVEAHYRWEQHAKRLSTLYMLSTERGTLNTESEDENRHIAPRGRDKSRPYASRITHHASQRNTQYAVRNVLMMTDVTGRGGAEKALVDLAVRLDRTRFNVTVCATRSAGNYQPVLDEAGVRTIILDRTSRRDMHKLFGLVRLLRRERIHILHTHLFGSNTWGRVLGRLAGVPVVIAHEHWSSKSQREVWVDRLLYRLSDRILVPSEASKRIVMEMERIPARHISVLYNGVDISHFTPASGMGCEVRQELGLKCDELVVGTVGRLSPEKGGVDVLVRAVERLRQTHPRARLLVVGDGALRPDLERVASELGSNAIFAGTRTDVARLLSAMDVFVLPSLKEAMPIALLEAMAMRLPVIATTVGGVPEIVDDGKTGLLVAPGDEADLHCALHRLADDPALMSTLARAGQVHVQANFTLDSMVAQVERLYDTLAEKKLGSN